VPDRHVPVLVVGGSLVGLSTSVLLATQGVPHLLVERHRGTAVHPRAASFHQRTMEIFRNAGLQEAVEAQAEKEFVQDGAIVSVGSLASDDVTYFYRSFNDGVEHLSPTSRLFTLRSGSSHCSGSGLANWVPSTATGASWSASSRTMTASPP
jgi:hypothetical protein